MIPEQILNYVLIRKIGEGGMGQVFLARNEALGTYVAIKSLHPRFASNPVLRQRFRNEARLLSSLNHPNIVRFLNYVENDSGVFLIMEYVEGQTLEDFIMRRNGLIIEERALPMATRILDAFSYAHSRGIVHRDIKPSNILISNDGEIKVLDFGIAAIVSEAADAEGLQGGTPSFMSPEQVKDRKPDVRSDIYSLGLLLYEMLTGRAPYDTETLSDIEIKKRVVSEPLPRMKEIYPYISDGAQKIVDRATSKEPEGRYTDCEEMIRDIDRLRTPRKNRRMLWPAIAVGCALLAGIGFWIWDYNRTKVKYFRDYTVRWEVPEGIGQLSDSEMSRRSASYRMEYSRGKLRRLTLVNSAGKPVDVPEGDSPVLSQRYVDVEYFYTDGGRIDYKKVYNAAGKIIMKLDYDNNLATVSFKHDDEYGTPARMGAEENARVFMADTAWRQTISPISRILLKHDEETGLLTMARYAGSNNEPLCDGDRFFAREYTYDDKGRVVLVKGLDINGSPRNDRNGRCAVSYEYDDDDNLIRLTTQNTAGQSVGGPDNCASVAYETDEWGNTTAERYYDAEGKAALRVSAGAYGYLHEFDERGNRITSTAIDANGRPMADAGGAARRTMKFNENGRMTEIAWSDTNGKPAYWHVAGDSVSIIRQQYDDRGHITLASFYDKAGQPKAMPGGYASIEQKFDEGGNNISTSFFDAKGSPARFRGFNSTVSRTFDNLGRVATERYLDANGKATPSPDGVFGTDYDYDRRGNMTAIRYIGPDGKKNVRNSHGVASVSMKYDETGNCVLVSYLNESKMPATMAGISRIERIFDPQTNLLVEEKVYGPVGLRETRRYNYDAAENLVNSSVKAPTTRHKSSQSAKNQDYKPDGGDKMSKGYRDYPSPEKAKKVRLDLPDKKADGTQPRKRSIHDNDLSDK